MTIHPYIEQPRRNYLPGTLLFQTQRFWKEYKILVYKIKSLENIIESFSDNLKEINNKKTA